MEIVSLFGAMLSYDKGLSKVTKLIYSTLKELGVTVNETNLGFSSIPYFDGIKSQSVDPIVKSIKKADGIIIATTSSFSTCSSIIQTFFEHLDVDDYKEILKQKNCMLVVVGNENTSFVPINHLSSIVNELGGYDSTRILLDTKFISEFTNNPAYAEIIEKQVEDFYRIIRQKRNFYLPNKGVNLSNFVPTSNVSNANNSMLDNTPNLQYNTPINPVVNNTPNIQNNVPVSNPVINNNPTYQNKYNSNSANRTTNNSLSPLTQGSQSYNSRAIDDFNNKQNDDIKEITQFFSQRYQNLENQNAPTNDKPKLEPLMPAMPSTTQKKTCRQLTASLVHHFQPQLSGGLVATIQINITGNENFSGYIQINNVDCYYYDGIADAPTISIISNDKVWTDVLTGKVTAQKCFMTGNLKIKGNFVLLTKFDQLFNTSKNLA